MWVDKTNHHSPYTVHIIGSFASWLVIGFGKVIEILGGQMVEEEKD